MRRMPLSASNFRSYGIKMADLIQEGNIGLMKAVQKFDADKGIRLISYAVWWIRAFIQNYILKSWSLVKLGTTQAQRKLFFSLARTRRELEKFDGVTGDMQKASEGAIAKKLRVKPGEVLEMQQRMEGRDLSLDAPMGEDGGSSHVDFVMDGADLPDAELAEQEERHIVQERVVEALSRLDPRQGQAGGRARRADGRPLPRGGAPPGGRVGIAQAYGRSYPAAGAACLS